MTIKIKGIYFDFFGTLIDALYAQQWIWARILRRLGIIIHLSDPRIKSGLKKRWKELERLKIEENKIYSDIDSADRERINEIMLIEFGIKHEEANSIINEEFENNFFKGYRLNTGCKETLEKLKQQNIKIGLNTNGDRLKVQKKLKELGIFPYFAVFIHSHDYNYEKNNIELYQIALKEMNVKDPKQVIHVGDDWEMDFLMAKKIGMIPVLFDSLNEYPNVHCLKIKKLPEILNLINSKHSVI